VSQGIRKLQCILLKIALVLGVEIYQNVTFLNVIEPNTPQQGSIDNFILFFCISIQSYLTLKTQVGVLVLNLKFIRW